MKHLHETFTDQEFENLLRVKKLLKLNWHDFLAKWLIVAAGNAWMNGTLGKPITKENMLEALRRLEEAKTK